MKVYVNYSWKAGTEMSMQDDEGTLEFDVRPSMRKTFLESSEFREKTVEAYLFQELSRTYQAGDEVVVLVNSLKVLEE